MSSIAVIPARYQSSRFPGKLLTKLKDKTVLEWTYTAAVDSKLFTNVIIATGDQRIAEVARSFGAKLFWTEGNYLNGTERVAEVASSFHPETIVVNVQGDEPMLQKEPLKALLDLFQLDQNIQISTIISGLYDLNELDDPNIVKVVRDKRGRALYFSRASIPYTTIASDTEFIPYFKHQGVYAYRNVILQKLAKLPPGKLELVEKLEQLRWVEHGYSIHTVVNPFDFISIDTYEDLKKAEQMLSDK